MSVTGVEFIRRFLLHVLPHGFMRIRHYGILANCHRRAKQVLICTLLQEEASVESTMSPGEGCYQRAIDKGNRLPYHCPQCVSGLMRIIGEVMGRRRPRRA